MGFYKWRPSKAQAKSFAAQMELIQRFCDENHIDYSNYSVTPVEIVKDPYGLAKEFALGKSFCVEAKQIKEIK